MNSIDIILSVFMFIFFLIGFRKGFIATIIHLAAFVLFFVLIAYAGPVLKEIVILYLNVNNFAAIVISYLIIFLFIFLISYILIKIITKILKTLKINWINRLLGGFLGIFNALIIITILFLIFSFLPINNHTKHSLIEQSKILSFIDVATKDLNVKNISTPDPIDQKIRELMKKNKKDEKI